MTERTLVPYVYMHSIRKLPSEEVIDVIRCTYVDCFVILIDTT